MLYESGTFGSDETRRQALADIKEARDCLLRAANELRMNRPLRQSYRFVAEQAELSRDAARSAVRRVEGFVDEAN